MVAVKHLKGHTWVVAILRPVRFAIAGSLCISISDFFHYPWNATE